MGSSSPPGGLQQRGEEGFLRAREAAPSAVGESWPSLGLRGRAARDQRGRFLFLFCWRAASAGGWRGGAGTAAELWGSLRDALSFWGALTIC